MKKLSYVLLSILFLAVSQINGKYVEASETNGISVSKLEDKAEILEHALEVGYENPEDILSITIVTDLDLLDQAEVLDGEVSQEARASYRHSFVGSNTLTVTSQILRQSIYSSAGSSMSISQTMETTTSLDAGITVEIIELTLGSSVLNSVTLTDTHVVNSVPSGKKVQVTAYPRVTRSFYDFYKKGLFGESYIGRGRIDRAIGVEFVERII